MDILIIADFCGRFDGKDNSRFLYLANLLSKDHSVEILTSDYNHGAKAYFEKVPTEYPYKVTMVHEGAYSRNISLKRFYAHYIWGRSVIKYLKQRKKPDVIYAAIPPLNASYLAAKYCEKNHIRFIIDIQDLWPEAFQMVFNVFLLSKLVFAPFKMLADGIYKRADCVIGVSETYVKRALSVNKKCRQGMTVFLGAELKAFDENVKNNPIKKDNELWLGYCGSMGDSYDLKCVINALALIEKAPKFIAMGDGQKRTEFEAFAKAKQIDCLFTGKLPYDQMCGWLSKCDMVVNPIVGASAASIINKHADYAASGLPVLNTQENEEYRKLVANYHMGFNCKNGDAKDLADKIRVLVNDEQLRREMGSNARRCASERFDRATTYKAIITEITGN